MRPGDLRGQRGRAQVEEGNRLYSEGLFDEAHEKYLEALLEDPESGLIRFNDGNALYQNADFQQAMERYMEAAESGDPALQSAAWYNLGNALFRAQESLEAYKQALRANPSDADAKHNLERVLEQLQQQDQQNDENQEGDQNQDSQDQQSGGQQDPQNQESPENQDQESERGEGEDQPQEGQPQTQEGQESPEEEQEAQPQPGEMTPEEAEQLLNAIREDPGDVNRKRAPTTGKRPRKRW
jgi:chemotaxis protein histidine kinase CheA